MRLPAFVKVPTPPLTVTLLFKAIVPIAPLAEAMFKDPTVMSPALLKVPSTLTVLGAVPVMLPATTGVPDRFKVLIPILALPNKVPELLIAKALALLSKLTE